MLRIHNVSGKHCRRSSVLLRVWSNATARSRRQEATFGGILDRVNFPYLTILTTVVRCLHHRDNMIRRVGSKCRAISGPDGLGFKWSCTSIRVIYTRQYRLTLMYSLGTEVAAHERSRAVLCYYVEVAYPSAPPNGWLLVATVAYNLVDAVNTRAMLFSDMSEVGGLRSTRLSMLCWSSRSNRLDACLSTTFFIRNLAV